METWKNIDGYDGYYSVSSYGNVRANTRRIKKSNGVVYTRNARMLRNTETKDGYLTVTLSRNGCSMKHAVHRLVANAFLPRSNDTYEINHKDFNRKNNRSDNLEWVSHAENIAKTIAAGRHVTQIKNMFGSGNPNYGNRSLSQRYFADAALAKEKQSRPGSQNGRSRKIEMIDVHGDVYGFPYIGACAKYLVDHGMYKYSITNAATKISKAARNGCLFLGMTYRFI